MDILDWSAQLAATSVCWDFLLIMLDARIERV